MAGAIMDGSALPVEFRTCKPCGERKPLTKQFFPFERGFFRHSCLSCRRSRSRDWVKNNPGKQRAADAKWKAKFRAAGLPRPNRGSTAKYNRARRLRADVKMAKAIADGIYKSIKRHKGGYSWETIVGYSARDLASHVERQFLPGMNWKNYGSEWHIDHIVPLSSFEIKSIFCPDLKAAWALSNLRPLWWLENLQKSDKRLFLI